MTQKRWIFRTLLQNLDFPQVYSRGDGLKLRCGNAPPPVETEVLPIRDRGRYTLPSQIEPTVQLKRKGAPNWFDSVSTQLEHICENFNLIVEVGNIFTIAQPLKGKDSYVFSHFNGNALGGVKQGYIIQRSIINVTCICPGVVNNSAVCKVKQCCFTLEVPAAITGAWLLTSNHPRTLRSELVYFYTGPPPLKEKRSLLVNIVHISSLLFYDGFAPHNFWMWYRVPLSIWKAWPFEGEPLLLNRFGMRIDIRGRNRVGGGDEDTGSVRETSGGEILLSDERG
ncbi:hypothetical protein BT96DRAFT_948628 [Gymnopus androsaceus JB14]|uniref:Uncharacterized protein n=1 Tax=Gymnopus androsaceus JB14 TaxID=1447944 RepID=A0A6A4GMW6_9AGAR|nr:hypothetical protein BT96DRAFT_948628 [Gymnopus androsaceus JB14]